MSDPTNYISKKLYFQKTIVKTMASPQNYSKNANKLAKKLVRSYDEPASESQVAGWTHPP
jgi:hypothetical protein